MVMNWCSEALLTLQKSKDPNMYIPVGIWEIEPADELALDQYGKGCRADGTGLYRKIKVAGIMTYTMNTDVIAMPTTGYFNTILGGYRDFGLDTNFLYDAAALAMQKVNSSITCLDWEMV